LKIKKSERGYFCHDKKDDDRYISSDIVIYRKEDTLFMDVKTVSTDCDGKIIMLDNYEKENLRKGYKNVLKWESIYHEQINESAENMNY
jgi:hypothetical protein